MICGHEDNCHYLTLEQIDGNPCYLCECGDCHQYFIIWLDEGKNEDIGGEKEYKELLNEIKKTITITVKGGVVEDVEGLPNGYDYIIDDKDI